MRIFFTLLYSIVNFVRILLLCDPPNVLISQLSTCYTPLLQIISMVLQPLTCTGIAWQRFLGVSICLVVDVSQLKEDLLPVFIVAFLIQMGIQILKQQRRVKALYFCKQAFIDFFSAALSDTPVRAFAAGKHVLHEPARSHVSASSIHLPVDPERLYGFFSVFPLFQADAGMSSMPSYHQTISDMPRPVPADTSRIFLSSPSRRSLG